MKKLLAFILIACISLQAPLVIASEENYDKAVEFMKITGLMQGDGNGSFNEERLVTYAEAAKVLCLVSNLPVDTAEYSKWYEPYMNTVIQFNVINTEDISAEETIDIGALLLSLRTILGYSDIGRENVNTAVNLELLKGVNLSGKKTLTRGQFAKIIYNALYTNMVEVIYTTGGNQYAVSDVTLLQNFLNKEDMTIYRGVVEETSMGSILNPVYEEEDYVVIGGKRYLYKGSQDLTVFLGKSVEFTVRDDSSAHPALLFVEEYRNTVYTTVGSDIMAMNLSGVTFEENEKKTKLSFENVKYVYNGYRVLNITDEQMLYENAKYEYIDNDNDGKIEIILATVYESFVVKNVSVPLQAIYFKGVYGYNGRKNISVVSKNNDDFVCSLVDTDGNSIEIDAVSPEDAVTIQGNMSGNRMRVTISKKRVSGAPSELFEDEVKINEQTFTIGKSISGAYLFECELGKSGDYIIDAYNNIIGMIENNDSVKYGYIDAVGRKSAHRKTIEMRIVSGGYIKNEETTELRAKPKYIIGNEAVEIYETADNFRINGEKLSYEDTEAVLSKAFVKYKLNSEGQISKIDVVTTDMLQNDKDFNPDIISFGGLFYIDDKTKIVCVPENADYEEEDYYKVITLEDTKKYNIVGYDIDEETKIAKAALIKENMILEEPGIIRSSAKCSVVEKIRGVRYEDEFVYSLTVWEDGKRKELYSSGASQVEGIIAGLGFGDVIYYSINSLGFIDNVEKVSKTLTQPFEKNIRAENECVLGTLYTIGRKELSEITNTEINTIGVSIDGSGADLVEYVVDDTKMPKIYLVNREEKTVDTITMNDLAPFVEFGSDAMQILVAKKHYAVSCVVAVR